MFGGLLPRTFYSTWIIGEWTATNLDTLLVVRVLLPLYCALSALIRSETYSRIRLIDCGHFQSGKIIEFCFSACIVFCRICAVCSSSVFQQTVWSISCAGSLTTTTNTYGLPIDPWSTASGGESGEWSTQLSRGGK